MDKSLCVSSSSTFQYVDVILHYSRVEGNGDVVDFELINQFLPCDVAKVMSNVGFQFKYLILLLVVVRM